MITYISTPDFYNDYIKHYNPNHDPRNGQFTSGPGGSPPVSKINQTEKYFKNASEISQVKSNKKNIAKELASEMIEDWKLWGDEDGGSIDDYLVINGKKVSESRMRNYLTNKLIKRINEDVGDGSDFHEIVKWNDGELTFYIDGIPEYSDSQPLYVDYNPKTKKITMWGYV